MDIQKYEQYNMAWQTNVCLTYSEMSEDSFSFNKGYMSLVERKPVFCICENKDADQLRSNCEADQRLCFCYTIKRIHHWCSVETGKSQPEGPPFQWETRLRFPLEQWTRGLGFAGSTVHQ